VSTGTGSAARLDRPQAGKTGTHENHTDVWFVGFIPQYTTSVWVGFPDIQVEMRNLVINGVYHDRAWGGTVAAPIWRTFMEIITEDLPVLDFPPDPDGTRIYYQTPSEEVPDVIGMDVDDAEDELHEAGFNVTIEYVNADEDEDEVIGQDPEHPERAEQATTVTIEVSNGRSPLTQMPDLIGLTAAEAVTRLQALQDETGVEFTWELIIQSVDTAAERNKVIATRPVAGSAMDKDTVVVIRYTAFSHEDGG